MSPQALVSMTGAVELDGPSAAAPKFVAKQPITGSKDMLAYLNEILACKEEATSEVMMNTGKAAALLLEMPEEGNETSGADTATPAEPTVSAKKPGSSRKRRKHKSLIDLAAAEGRRTAATAQTQAALKPAAAPQAYTLSASPNRGSTQECGKTTASKFCPYCRAEVLHTFKFCMSCGGDVAAIWKL